jgi:glyoxylase-like metal-dependent hydrolase (beta-lactamase superfamily II)
VARDAAIPLAANVWRIPTAPAGLVNSFAFRDDDGTVTLVDAGLRSARRRLLAALSAIGAEPEQVRRVVVTHAHGDHAGGLARVVEATGAEVSTHERDAIYLREGRVPQRDRSARGRRLAGFLVRGFAKVTVGEEFRDGTVLPVAGGLRVVHTPGHTPGHVSLLHQPTGVLITGDAVFNVRGLRWSPPLFCTDVALNRRSADVLGDLDYEVAAFTHGAEVRHQAREAVRAFLRGRAR